MAVIRLFAVALLVVACSPTPEVEPAPRETIRFVYAPDPEPKPKTAERTPLDLETIRCGATTLAHFKIPTDGNHPVDAIDFRDSEGNVIHPSVFCTGAFNSLCAQGRFLLIHDDAIFGSGPSFLMSSEGTRLATLELSNCPSIGVSSDHQIFWAQSHAFMEPINTRVRAFDFNGNELLDRTFTEKRQKVDVTFDTKVYTIDVLDPDLPC